MFDEVNRDALVTPTATAARGRQLGFLGALQHSWDATARTETQFGLEMAFRQVEQEQIRRMRQAGIQPPPSLNDKEDGVFFSGMTGGVDSEPYLRVARGFYNAADDDELETLRPLLSKRNEKLRELRSQYPELNIRTYDELWSETQRRAQEAESKWNNSNTTWGGMVGGFIGAAGAGMHPGLSPLSTLTAPVAGGATALARIGVQGAAQGATQAVEQYTGIAENRRLLGVEEQNPLVAIGAAAVFGAGFQAVGEGISAGARRWFRSAPNDPAPPPPAPEVPRAPAAPPPAPEVPRAPAAPEAPAAAPARVNVFEDFDAFMREVQTADTPLGPSRMARARTAIDLDYMGQQLDALDGPMPWELAPATMATPQPYPTHWRGSGENFQRIVDGLETPDQIARRIDPELFNKVDKITQRMETLQRWQQELQPQRAERQLEATATLRREVDDLRERLERATPKNRRTLQRQLDEAQMRLDDETQRVSTLDTPDTRQVRERYQALDQELRDLAPLITRAYNAARAEYRSTQQLSNEALAFLRQLDMTRERFRPDKDAPFKPMATQPKAQATPTPRDISDIVPALGDPVVLRAANVEPGAPAVTKLAAVQEVLTKTTDEATEKFRALAARLVDEAAEAKPEGNKLVLAGRELDLDMKVVVDDGEMTIRQYLKRVADDDAELSAVTTCSARS